MTEQTRAMVAWGTEDEIEIPVGFVTCLSAYPICLTLGVRLKTAMKPGTSPVHICNDERVDGMSVLWEIKLFIATTDERTKMATLKAFLLKPQ